MSVPEIALSNSVLSNDVLADGMDAMATPIEFTFKGKRFRIHAVLSRWCEAGGWWNRVSDGRYRPDDGARALKVAAPYEAPTYTSSPTAKAVAFLLKISKYASHLWGRPTKKYILVLSDLIICVNNFVMS